MKDWHTARSKVFMVYLFENKTMVAALVGRLTFMSHVLNMNSSNPYRDEHAAVITSGKEAVSDE